MKNFVYLLAFATSQSFSCEPNFVSDLRPELETAFKTTAFGALVDKYGGPGSVQIRLQNLYDDDNPLTIIRFDNLSGLATWFDEKHKHANSMFVPEKVTCREFDCNYVLPEQTLHHGTYLLGFETVMIGECTYVTELSLSWE